MYLLRLPEPHRRSLLHILQQHGMPSSPTSPAPLPVEGFASTFNAIAPAFCSASRLDYREGGALGPASENTWDDRVVYANPPFTEEMITLALNLGRRTQACLLIFSSSFYTDVIQNRALRAGFSEI